VEFEDLGRFGSELHPGSIPKLGEFADGFLEGLLSPRKFSRDILFGDLPMRNLLLRLTETEDPPNHNAGRNRDAANDFHAETVPTQLWLAGGSKGREMTSFPTSEPDQYSCKSVVWRA
jgi:hypothetical protein